MKKVLIGLMMAAALLAVAHGDKLVSATKLEQNQLDKPGPGQEMRERKPIENEGQLLFRLRRPTRLPGMLVIEAENSSPYRMELVEFSLQVLGQGGELQMTGLAPGQKQRKEISIESTLELSIDHVIVVDDRAQRRRPKVLVRTVN